MKNKILLFLLFLLPLGLRAQKLTDKEIINFVKKEQQKGATQSEIVTRLLGRGVTVDQLRSLRKKMEAQKKQMGAVDLTQKESKQSRLREEKETDSHSRQKSQEDNMGRLPKKKDTELRRDQIMEAMGKEMEFMDIDSVLYYKNMLEKERSNQVFGRNLFNNRLLTFEPSQNLATPQNYVLGPGDKLFIDVWGASQKNFEAEISPDGAIVLDGVGLIRLGGMSVQAATKRLRAELGKYYADSQVSLSLGENRSIQVQVMGEVRMPGTYTLSSLSSTFNALYSAGGISDIGTLRNIKVYRGGRQVGLLDVYDYLLNGNASGDIRLQDNDVIVVGPYEALVEVRGKVKRPMFYEMRKNESVKQLIDAAGGFMGEAYRNNIHLRRKSGKQYTMHTVGEFQMSGFTLQDGDSIFVDSIVSRFENRIEARGALMHPGHYELGKQIQTVRDLLEACGGLREDAFRSRAVMHRLLPDLTLEMCGIDLDAVLEGREPDVALRNGDVLFVPSVVEMQAERTLSISGEVRYPGDYRYAEGTRVEDLILMAGGVTEAASSIKVDIFRRLNNSHAQSKQSLLSLSYTISLESGLRATDSSLVLMPYDYVVVRRSPVYRAQQMVRVEGCVNFEGEYAMQSRDYRLSDLVKAAGGLSGEAYSRGGRLIRQLTKEEQVQRASALRAAQIQMYEEAMQNNKEFDAKLADSLMTLKLDMGDTYPVAVDLEAALKQPGCSEDVVLREGDVLVVPQFSNTVKVSGEVAYANSMNYVKGKPLNYYIERAGGYANKAKKKGVYVVYLNGSVKRLKYRTAKYIRPGCEIVVPTKREKKGLSTSEIVAVTSGAASLASVIIALITILK